MRCLYLSAIVGLFFACIAPCQCGRAEDVTPEQRRALVRAAEQIEASDAVTWSTQGYMRFSSNDGSRTWLKPIGGHSVTTYVAPGLFRDVRYMPDGSEMLVELVDAEEGKCLRINPKEDTAYWVDDPINIYEAKHPFTALAKILREGPLDFVGTQEHDDATVNVFRYVSKGRRTPMELWVDSKAASLVGVSMPRGESIDLSKIDSAEKVRGAKREMAGQVRAPIDWHPEIDDALFELKVPDGFDLVDAPISQGPINP